MTPSNRQRVLQDAANKASTNNDNTIKGKPKITEEQWREFMLEYYEADNKRVVKFLTEKGIVSQQNIQNLFDKRWRSSGLQEMKKWKAAKEKALIVYDNWISDEKEGKRKKKSQIVSGEDTSYHTIK